jgi:integrase
MARPRTEIGTFGRINTTEVRPSVYEARARFRLRNGRLKPVKRRGPSKTAAERRLKAAMAKLANEASSKTLNVETRFGIVIDLWLAEFKKKVERGERAHKSLYDYEDTAEQLRKHMGELTCGEADNAGLCDETLKAIRDQAAKSNRSKRGGGYAAAKRAKTVLTGICGLAVRHGAMTSNPAKSAEAIEQRSDDKEDVRALEPDERRDFLTKLRGWCIEKADSSKRGGLRAQAWRDLPDQVEAMLATGSRPGEILAAIGPGVNPQERTVLLDHHLVRVEAVGLVRKFRRKGGGEVIEPMYPTWAAPMFARRKLAAGEGPLFPTWNGQWTDPSNVQKRLREACDAIGYEWMAARMLRHTVGTHIVDQGGTNEDAADQLGNTPDVVQRHYRRPRRTNPKNAAALESLLGEQDDQPETGS